MPGFSTDIQCHGQHHSSEKAWSTRSDIRPKGSLYGDRRSRFWSSYWGFCGYRLWVCVMLMTPGLSNGIQRHVWPHFSELANRQIRHQATHKVFRGLCGYVWVNMLILSPLRVMCLQGGEEYVTSWSLSAGILNILIIYTKHHTTYSSRWLTCAIPPEYSILQCGYSLPLLDSFQFLLRKNQLAGNLWKYEPQQGNNKTYNRSVDFQNQASITGHRSVLVMN